MLQHYSCWYKPAKRGCGIRQPAVGHRARFAVTSITYYDYLGVSIFARLFRLITCFAAFPLTFAFTSLRNTRLWVRSCRTNNKVRSANGIYRSNENQQPDLQKKLKIYLKSVVSLRNCCNGQALQRSSIATDVLVTSLGLGLSSTHFVMADWSWLLL